MRKIIIFLIFMCVLSIKLSAQKAPDSNPALTADSLATGNYKDVLNSFFQLAFDKLTGNDKELKFTSTPFAIMAKMDSSLLIDTIYKKYSTLRNINFSFGLKLDSSYKFNGFSSGVKYALINERDETVKKAFTDLVINNSSVQELYALNNLMGASLSQLAADTTKAQKLIKDYHSFLKGERNYNDLDQELQDSLLSVARRNLSTQKIADTLAANKNFNINQAAADIYTKLKSEFNNNALWTIGLSDTTYKDQFFFSNIVITSEFLKGITPYKNKNDVELNLKAALQFVDDSLNQKRDLKRSIFSFEPGINIVFKTKVQKKSYLEFKLSGSYYHNFGSLYADEERDRLTLNSTFRIRIIDDIWIPLELKYDPKNGNFFGFLNVRANFKALGSVAKFLKP
jgi:hypothetical protein